MIGTSKNIWGFDPRSVPGCALWLDAADTSTLTLSGTNITAWRDKSVLSNNVNAISATPPTFSSVDSSVNFSATSATFLRGALSDTYSNNATVFAVASVTPTPELSTGVVTTFAGNGTGSYVNGTGTNATFQFPGGVTLDGSGTVYVIDTWNFRIRRITPLGVVSLLAGSGTATFADGTGAGASFAYPGTGVTDNAGNLYVADTNNQRIRRIVISTGVVTTLAGNGTATSVNGTGGSATFNTPAGIAISTDNTRLFVTELFGNRVRQIIISTAVVTTLAGSGTGASTDGTGTGASFFYPLPIAADRFGNLYVGDPGSHRIRKINIASTVVITFAGSSLGTNNGTGTNAQFNYPSGLTCDENGNVYVAEADTPRIRKITSAGVVTTFAGSGTATSVDGTGTNATFSKPRQLFYNSDGIIYVADEVGHRIRKMNTKTVNLTFPQLSSLGSNAATENNLIGQSFKIQGVTPNLLTFVENSSNLTGQGSNIQTYLSNNLLNTKLILANTSTYSGTTFGITSILNGAAQTFSSVISTLATNSSNVNTYNKYAIGGMLNVTATVPTSFNGKLFEYLVFNNALTSVQRQQIEGYLAWKWGLTTLPSTHPFSSIRPHLRTFQPSDVPGCALWLDGADLSSMTFSGSSITQWSDKSGNGYNALPNGSAITMGTLNGVPAITFPAASTAAFLLGSSLTVGSGGYSVFFVANQTGFGSGGTRIYAANGGGIQSFVDNGPSPPILSVYNGSSMTSTFTVISNVPFMYSYTISSSASGLWKNGISAGTGGGSTTSITNFYIGNFSDVSLVYAFTGQMGEFLIYNTALTTSQRQQVEGYLAHKWGLTPSLSVISPLSIPGCQSWLDGADTSSMTLSGSNLIGWRDKSLNVSTITSILGSNVLTQNAMNGRPAILLNGSSSFTGSTTGSGTTLTVCIVATQASECVSDGGLVCFGRTGFSDWNDVGSLAITKWATNSGRMVCTRITNSQIVNTGLSTPFIYILVFDGTFVNSYLNGTIQTPTNISRTGTFAYTKYTIGNRADTGNAYWTGFIGESIVYNTALTTSERQQIEGYLARKWGISISATLPSLHLFKSFPPASLPFSPRNISGLTLWLDAADASTITYSSGTNLSQWRDKSGNGYIMSNNAGTTTVAANSLNSLNTVYTPSGTNTKITNFSGRTKMTLFIVGKCAAGKYLIAFNGGFLYLGNNSLLYMNPPSGAYLDITDSIGLTNSVVSNNTWFIFCIGYDNLTNSKANPYTINGSPVNGTNRATIATPSGTPGILADQFITNTLYINSANGTNSYDSDYTAELIYYNDTLSVSQRQQVEGYLAHKWGLASSLFTPLSIPGCQLWLDAADTSSMTLSGSNVTQWRDKSGNSNNATQSTTANQPTSGTITQSGLNVLNLTNKTMTYPVISLSTMTIFCVYRQLDFTGYRSPLSVGAFAFFYANGGNVGIGRLGVTDEVLANYSTYGITSDNYTIYGGTVSISGSTTTNMYFNGTNVASNTVNSSGGIVRYEIGRSELTSTGYIAEVLIYNSVLTTTQRQQIEGHLAKKWGIGSSSMIPSTHPFSRIPPA